MNESKAAGPDLAHADIGLVCALPLEIAPFIERCEKVRKYTGGDFVFRGGRYDSIRIAAVETGVGFARARRATQSLLDAHSPPWILSVGFSGSLRADICVGQIVVATSISDVHGQSLTLDVSVPAEPEKGLHVGPIVNTDAIVRTVDEKQQLAEQTGAVDLESLAVAQVCRDRGVPFMAVRVISDDMSRDLPPEILSLFGTTGTVRLGAAVTALWKRPASGKDMWAMRESARKAALKLAGFLDGVVHQLYEAKH